MVLYVAVTEKPQPQRPQSYLYLMMLYVTVKALPVPRWSLRDSESLTRTLMVLYVTARALPVP